MSPFGAFALCAVGEWTSLSKTGQATSTACVSCVPRSAMNHARSFLRHLNFRSREWSANLQIPDYRRIAVVKPRGYPIYDGSKNPPTCLYTAVLCCKESPPQSPPLPPRLIPLARKLLARRRERRRSTHRRRFIKRLSPIMSTLSEKNYQFPAVLFRGRYCCSKAITAFLGRALSYERYRGIVTVATNIFERLIPSDFLN